AAQPVIQCRLAALKPGEIVILPQFFRGRKGLLGHCSHGAAVRSSRRNRGLAAGGRSSIDKKRLKSSAGKEKYRRSSKTASASRQAVSSMKSERLRLSAVAARSISAFWLRVTRRLMFWLRVLSALAPVAGMKGLLLYAQSVYTAVRTSTTR